MPVRRQGARHGFDPQAFIKARLPILPDPVVPEIRLHRAQPSSGLWRLDAGDGSFGSPYWAYPWPGGQILARHVLDHPETVSDRRILDLGAGSGLVAIAAAKAEAKEVIAAEIDAYAIAAIRLNAEENDVALRIVIDDLTASDPPPVDLILVGDLFYAPDLAQNVSAFLERCAASGIVVLVGDIGRRHLPKARLRPIAEYPVHDFAEGADREARPGFVFAFETSESGRGGPRPNARRRPPP